MRVDNDLTRVYKDCNNSIAMTPNPRVAPGGGEPNSDRKVRGVNRSEGSVGHSSFGPNPTANLAGAKERGHSGPSGSVSGEPTPDRAAWSGQPHAGYVSAVCSGNHLGAASGSRAGDCVPSMGVEVRCGTGLRRCCTFRKRRCRDASMSSRRRSRIEVAISDGRWGHEPQR
jgi:hypothetical protein